MLKSLTSISRLHELTRKVQALIIAGVVIVIAIVLVIGLLIKHSTTESPHSGAGKQESAQASGTFRPTKEQWGSLKVAPVQLMSFKTELVTDGNIAYNDDTTTPVFSPYSGRVSKLIAKLGDTVKRGAPLMMVETTDFIQARNNLIAAVTAFNSARNQLQRSQTTEYQNTLNTDQAILIAARDQLRILGNSDAEIDAIEHDPDRQKMNQGAYVLAPITGTVTLRQVGLGQYITSAEAGASTPVYTISNLSTVWLIANVRETDASKMRVGQPIEVTVPAYPDKVFKAKIVWVAASIDPNIRRLPVRAEVENPNLELKPMMLASFRIVVGKEMDALGVPQSSVVYEGSEAHVWVVGDDGSVALRLVHVGRTMNGKAEIFTGLKAGEKVITSGTLFIDRAAENDNP